VRGPTPACANDYSAIRSCGRLVVPPILAESRLGSNANFAEGGISRGHQLRRDWPLPPLRPKRAASGVAVLRSGSGQRKTNHALMSETSAGKPQPKAIPLNI
jgi:hypothetical protein